MSELPEFFVERMFDAPRDLIWQAWTDPDLLHQWYGPGVDTVIHKFELQVDGEWLNEMKMQGGSNFQKAIFKEVCRPQKLVWHHCSADADWNIAANPMMPDWPRILLTTLTLDEVGQQTQLRLTQVPLEATDAEIACFSKMKDGMSSGWGSGFAVIDELLKASDAK